MRRVIKAFVYRIAAVSVAIVVTGIVTLRFGDAALYPVLPGERNFSVAVANHGVHAGLTINLEDLHAIALKSNDPLLLAVHERFSAFQWLEIGWGDETFYRFAPTLSHVTAQMAFNALAGLNQSSVLHVVGLNRNGPDSFPRSDVVEFHLSEKGMTNVMQGLSKSFDPSPNSRPIELGEGIYGASLFYKASGHYSLLMTCNRWIADLMNSGGLAASPLPAVLSSGLLAELRWRN